MEPEKGEVVPQSSWLSIIQIIVHSHSYVRCLLEQEMLLASQRHGRRSRSSCHALCSVHVDLFAHLALFLCCWYAPTSQCFLFWDATTRTTTRRPQRSGRHQYHHGRGASATIQTFSYPHQTERPQSTASGQKNRGDGGRQTSSSTSSGKRKHKETRRHRVVEQELSSTKVSTSLAGGVPKWREALATLKQNVTVSVPGQTQQDDPSKILLDLPQFQHFLDRMKDEKEWKEAVQLLRWMETTIATSAPTTTLDLSVYHSVIACCVASGQAEQAVTILQAMNAHGLSPKTSSFQTTLSLLSRQRKWRQCLQLLDTMVDWDIPRTVVTYNTVISACSRAREVGMAKSLLSRMKTKDNLRPDETTYSTIIGACASTSRWKDALLLLDLCNREPGVTPNIFIYTNAMRACAKGGKYQRALSILDVVKDRGMPVDVYAYTAVIEACSKSKQWKKALALFEEMKEAGVKPSEVTYSVMISALGNGLQWERALLFLQEMQANGITPNIYSYNAAITALAKASKQKTRRAENVDDLSSKALTLLEQMKKAKIEPDGFSYSSAIACCGADGRWVEACELIETMKRGGPRNRPNRVAYTAAISACGRSGEATKAFQLFQDMKADGLSADVVAYNAVFSSLRIAEDVDKTYNLWQEICGTVSSTSRALAAASTPDIITVTECIATLSHAGRLDLMDEVFAQAVERGVVLRNDSLDEEFEVDLSGMALPVARAACRYVMKRVLSACSPNGREMVFITGVGRAHHQRGGASSVSRSETSDILDKNPATSLQDFIRGILEADFDPPLEYYIPERAPGSVAVKIPESHNVAVLS